eukprot:jgi/Chrzof1/270/Cz01g09130.t1
MSAPCMYNMWNTVRAPPAYRSTTVGVPTARHLPSHRLSAKRSSHPVQVRAADATCAVTARTFLDELANAKLGQIRFIVISDGAILEAVSDMTRLKYTDIPSRGTLATFSTEDKTFECHLTLSRLKEARIAQSKAKQGDYDLYAIRFANTEDKVVLSCLIHGHGGQYKPEAVQSWKVLQDKYGATVSLQ